MSTTPGTAWSSHLLEGTQLQPLENLYLEEVVQGTNPKDLSVLSILRIQFPQSLTSHGVVPLPPVMNSSCISFSLCVPSSTQNEIFGATNRIRSKTTQTHPPGADSPGESKHGSNNCVDKQNYLSGNLSQRGFFRALWKHRETEDGQEGPP